MSTKKGRRLCIFCGQPGVTREHVWAPGRIPNDHPRLLFATRRPIDYSAVWLTSCNDQTMIMSHTIKPLAPELRIVPGTPIAETPNDEALLFNEPGRFKGYLQTIRIQAFVSQILWSDSRYAVESVMGWPDSLHHARI